LSIEYYLIGEIKSVINKDGFVLVKSFSDVPDRFLKTKSVFLDFFGSKKELFIEEAKGSGANVSVKFKSFDTESDSQYLVGKNIYITEKEAELSSADVFYVHDVIGSEVYRNGVLFGKVEDVLQLPANDVYVITKTDGKEYLLPAVFDYIESFDPKGKRLTLKPGDSDFYDED
jgi:16S rRNA processing protein RimM